MSRARRLAGVLVGTGFRAAPSTAWLSLVLSIVAAVCSVVYTVGLKVMIDGALARSGGRIALGATLVAVLFTLSWLLAVIAGSRSSLLTDKTSLALGLRIMRVAASLPTLEHFERPELLARLDTLTGGRRTLAGAPRQLISLLGQALRAVGVVVLLALIYPPVLVVPMLALAPAFADRRAGRVQRRADESLAEDRRMLQALFTLATTAASARELRTYGLTDALPARHAQLAETIRRRTVRAALVSAVWEAAGWIVFAAGLVAAIVVLVLRAAHGEVSPGSVVEAVTLMRRAQTQISRSTDTAGSFQTSMAAAGELLWLEDHEALLSAPVAPAGGSSRAAVAVPARLEHGIVFEQVRFAYPGTERVVLGPLDLSLPAGASVALVGENGAGKTTLVKLLCGMYAPLSGAYPDRRRGDLLPVARRVAAARERRLPGLRALRARAPGVGRGRLARARRRRGGRARGARPRGRRRARSAASQPSPDARRDALHGRAGAVGRGVAAAGARPRPDAARPAARRSRRTDRVARRGERDGTVQPLRGCGPAARGGARHDHTARLPPLLDRPRRRPDRGPRRRPRRGGRRPRAADGRPGDLRGAVLPPGTRVRVSTMQLNPAF